MLAHLKITRPKHVLLTGEKAYPIFRMVLAFEGTASVHQQVRCHVERAVSTYDQKQELQK